MAAFQRLLDRHGEQGILIGGVATSLLGAPRLTADIDGLFLMSVDDLPVFMGMAEEEGFLPRIPDAEAFARNNRVLLLVHSNTGINIDISLGILPFEEEAVQRSHRIDIGDLSLLLPSIEDLIVMKAVADRPKDLLDIQSLVRAAPTLDIEYIKKWVKEFEAALETPQLWEAISREFHE